MWSGPTLHQQISCAILSQPYLDNIVRSSRLQIIFKISVLKTFANFTLKHLWWSFFLIKLQFRRLAILFKKKLLHRCFPVNIAKFLRTPFFYRTPLVAVSAFHRWFCAILAHVDEDKIVLNRLFFFKITAASSEPTLHK